MSESLFHLRKLTEKLGDEDDRIRESEELLRIALSAANAGAWTWNIEKDVVVGTTKFHELFGRSISTFQEFINCIHPDDVEKTKAAVKKSIDSRVDYDTIYRIKSPHGWKNIRAIGRPIKNSALSGICIEVNSACQGCSNNGVV